VGCHGQPTMTIPGESAENLTLMRLLDQQYTDTPYYGIRRMTAWLRSQGYAVITNGARLLHTMGLETIYPKPRLSQPHPRIGCTPTCCVGCRSHGEPESGVRHDLYPLAWWVYLPGGGDGLVHRICPVLAVSITMDVSFCLEAVRPSAGGRTTGHFQHRSAQFTSHDFTERLQQQGFSLVWTADGRLTMSFWNGLWRTRQI